MAYENEEKNTLKNELQKLKDNKFKNKDIEISNNDYNVDNTEKLKIDVVIGPEGALSTKDVDKLIDSGAKYVTLGKRILRTETAPIVIISNIIYEFEM